MQNVPILSLVAVCLSGVQVIIFIIATIYAIRQLKENTRVRQVEVMDKIFEYVSAPDARTARKKARNLNFPENFGDLSDDEIEVVEFTLMRN